MDGRSHRSLPVTSTNSERQLSLDLGKATSHAREDFVVSDCNHVAVAAVESWPRWPGGKLALVGPAGTGKTHLARVWAAKVGATTPEFEGGLVPAPTSGAIIFEDADRRMADDLLFHMFNMADAGVSLLVTGRTPPAEWASRLPDLRSRLKALTVATLEPPDDVVLLGVMNKLFSERNIRPTPGVGAYIIRRIERSPQAVQDVVRRIDECASADKREITLALVRQIFHGDDETLDREG